VRILSAMLVFLATMLPAAVHATAPSQRLCRVDNPKLPKGAALIKTFAADGKQQFQSSLAISVMKHGDKKLRVFLVWPDGTPSALPKLWIVHEDFSHEGIVTQMSQLRVQPLGGHRVAEKIIGRQMSRGDYQIFEVDPGELGALFAGEAALTIRIVDVGPGRALPREYGVKEEINLAQLQTEIASHAAVSRESAAMPCTTAVGNIPAEVDAREYTDCAVNISNETGIYNASEYRFWWQLSFGQVAYLNADRMIYSDEDAEAFLALMADPFASPNGISVDLGTSYFEKSGYPTLSFIFTADTVRYEVQSRQGEAKLDWPSLMRLDATGSLIRVVAKHPSGKVLADTTLPARLFRTARATLIDVRAKVMEASKNRMKFCAPQQSIIVT
jgi:hypothetical protein